MTKTEQLRAGLLAHGARAVETRAIKYDTYQMELPTPMGFRTYYAFQSRRGFSLRLRVDIGQGHTAAYAESMTAPTSLINMLLLKGAQK